MIEIKWAKSYNVSVLYFSINDFLVLWCEIRLASNYDFDMKHKLLFLKKILSNETYHISWVIELLTYMQKKYGVLIIAPHNIFLHDKDMETFKAKMKFCCLIETPILIH